MPRRRYKQPSQFRFLRSAFWGATPLLIALLLQTMLQASCASSLRQGVITCAILLPSALLDALFAVFAAGCLHSGWRAYQDFGKGQYELDRLDG